MGGPVAWGSGAAMIASSFIPDYDPNFAKQLDDQFMSPLSPLGELPSTCMMQAYTVKKIFQVPHDVSRWTASKIEEKAPWLIPVGAGIARGIAAATIHPSLARNIAMEQLIETGEWETINPVHRAIIMDISDPWADLP